VEKEEKGSMYGKATKGTLTKRTGIPCKEKSAGRRKKVKESKGRRDSMCG